MFVAEQKYREANGIISGVIQTFEKGSECAMLADALTIQGIVWSRVGVYDKSMSILRRAIDVAEDAGALSNGGLAALTLIEEHGARRLNPTELYNVYRRVSGLRIHDKNFSLYGALQEMEAKFIEQALEEEGGSVSRAAKLLGISHSSLVKLLNNRHKSLLHKRKPAQRRLRSIIKKQKT